jgi:hypothetical protein
VPAPLHLLVSFHKLILFFGVFCRILDFVTGLFDLLPGVFSTALSISFPACSAGYSCFCQPDSAATKMPIAKAAAYLPNFIICIS